MDVSWKESTTDNYRETTNMAVVGFPREKVDLSTEFGNRYDAIFKVGDTISIYLVRNERRYAGIMEMTDTVRTMTWVPMFDGWLPPNAPASVTQRENGRAIITIHRPVNSLLLDAIVEGQHHSLIGTYSCTLVDCLQVRVTVPRP